MKARALEQSVARALHSSPLLLVFITMGAIIWGEHQQVQAMAAATTESRVLTPSTICPATADECGVN